MALIDFGALTPEQRQQLLNGPALAPPEGVVPDLDHPGDNNAAGHVTLAICLVIVTISVLTRSYIGYFCNKPRLPDHLNLIAYGLFLGLCALVYTLMTKPGLFVHQWEIRLGATPDFLLYTFHAANVYSPFIGLIKAAILLDWIQIFVPHGTRNFMFWACHFFIWTNLLWAIAMVVTNNIACDPYEYNYNKLIEGNCDRVSTASTNLAASIFNFVMDVLVLFLPQRVIWGLRMSLEKRIGVSLVFLVGIAAIVATGTRLAITLINVNSEDYTYTFSAVMLCCIGEATCGFIVLCGPTFPKAFNILTQSKFMISIRSFGSRTFRRTGRTEDTGDSTQRFMHRTQYAEIENKRNIHLKPMRKSHSVSSELPYDGSGTPRRSDQGVSEVSQVV